MKLSHAVVVALLLSFLTPGLAQQPHPPPAQQTAPTKDKQQPQSAGPKNQDEVVRISTTLVQVDVAVTDRKGRPVTDLKLEEFEIYEDGRRRQPIAGQRSSTRRLRLTTDSHRQACQRRKPPE
jgi:hypothetical protein